MKLDLRATVGAGLAAIGAQRLWTWAHGSYTRGRVLRDDRAASYDAYLASLSGGGEPLFLVSPTATSTLIYFEGFRSRWVAGMYGEWLRDLHRRLDLNVVVPAIGLHGLPYRQRNLPWDYRLDVRQAIQLYDLYAAAQGPGHKISVMSSCAGSFCALALLAARPVDSAILLAPAAAGFRAPRRMKRYARFLVATGAAPFIFPTYYRRGGDGRVGNWDVVDEERRELANGTIVGNREWNSAQFAELMKGSRWADRELVPRVRGRRITVVWGGEDSFMPPASIARLSRRLSENGNEVSEMVLPETGHMVLMDRFGERVKERVEMDLVGAAEGAAR